VGQRKPRLETLAKDELSTGEFEAFLTEWRTFADAVPEEAFDSEISAAEKLIATIEKKTEKALHRLVEITEQGGDHFQPNSQFLGFSCGAVLVDRSGTIIQANDQAARQFDIEDQTTLDQLNWSLSDGGPLVDALKPDRKKSPDGTNFSLIRAQEIETEHDLNLAILHLGPNKGHSTQVLIVIVDAPWTDSTSQLVGAKFGLTAAESNIASDFAQGSSLRAIADLRGKSYATVRNQFQSVLEKTGCANQVELLRMLLGTSHLLAQLETLMPPARDQHSRDINIVRPGQRFVEAKLIGDLSGHPFLFVPSVFGHSITPAIEKLLVEQKLLMVSVVRPGFGGTSPPSKDQTEDQCFASDVTAILDNMGIEQCPIMGRASAARSVFNLLSDLPERLTSGYLVNAVVPGKYVKRDSIRSKWTQSLFSAANLAPGVASLILGAGGRILLRTGTERFIRRMYANSPADQEIVGDPEVAKSIREGVIMTIQQGPETGIRDMIRSFGDWSKEADRVNAPITMIHGTKDPHVPIDGVRSFVAAAPRKRRLLEIAAGGLLNYSHAERLFDCILSDLHQT